MSKLAQDIILRPIITEESMLGTAEKKYTFSVAKNANKIEIASAVEELFNVKVAMPREKLKRCIMLTDVSKEIKEEVEKILGVRATCAFKERLVLLQVIGNFVFFVVGKYAPESRCAVSSYSDFVPKASLKVL